MVPLRSSSRLLAVGVGPSSSHTVGPMCAAHDFAAPACGRPPRAGRAGDLHSSRFPRRDRARRGRTGPGPTALSGVPALGKNGGNGKGPHHG
ncbi:serine dehydratase beta chain [Microbacterium sp.]|uniref:serine dehydratase beta chain n=1 Tax=Microbacterium sp. TaxID=51671 RepID=UPI0025D5EE5B|nr:serine dehydratase beta chain [Microbacterium sp.]